jgi:hypothetical protein
MESTFKNFADFVSQAERTMKEAKDFVAPSSKIAIVRDEFITVGDGQEYKLNEFCNGQLAGKLQIPKMYWDRARAVPGLRSTNANAWLDADPNRGRMVRTINDIARAFVSDRFMRIDNYPVLEAIYPVLEKAYDSYGIEIVSNAFSETKMYLQIVFPRKQGEVKVGDTVQAGVTILNSEVGAGSYDIQTWTRRLVCMNGMVGTSLFRKYHLGRKMDSYEEEDFSFKSDTIQSELKTISLKSRDALDEAINGSWFNKELDKMKASAIDVVAKPVDTVEKTVKLLGLPESSKDSLLSNLIKGGELSRWGLANAVTALAHEDSFKDPDKAYQVETMGQQVLSMSKYDWERISA